VEIDQFGVDVSNAQGEVKWSQLRESGVAFAWAKATDGINTSKSRTKNNSIQTTFEPNMRNGTNAGVIMGAYHFAQANFRPDTQGARDEATNFFKTLYNPEKKIDYLRPGYLRPMLDVEDPKDGTDNGSEILGLNNEVATDGTTILSLTNWVTE